jgi:hypothetical protein
VRSDSRLCDFNVSLRQGTPALWKGFNWAEKESGSASNIPAVVKGQSRAQRVTYSKIRLKEMSLRGLSVSSLIVLTPAYGPESWVGMFIPESVPSLGRVLAPGERSESLALELVVVQKICGSSVMPAPQSATVHRQ